MPITVSLPEVLTVDEVASFLRVKEEQVQKEIASSRLRVLRIGEETRVLREDLIRYLRPSSTIHRIALNRALKPAPKFTYIWPNGEAETYYTAFAGNVRVDDEWKTLKIGITDRLAAGRMRKRAVIFLNGRPRAEFVGSDNFEQTRLVVCLIKTKSGRHVRAQEIVPFEYKDFKVEPYNLHVTGPHAFSGLAVICDFEDRETMATVCLIREQADETNDASYIGA